MLGSSDHPTHQQNDHSFSLVINNHSQNTYWYSIQNPQTLESWQTPAYSTYSHSPPPIINMHASLTHLTSPISTFPSWEGASIPRISYRYSFQVWILHNDKYLRWSLVWYFTPVNSCMARFTSAVTSVDSGQMERGNSSIPHPLVNTTEVFTLHIRVCSITRSLHNPVQNISLLWITWNPFWNICYTFVLTAGSY